jgi:hypothetical protein
MRSFSGTTIQPRFLQHVHATQQPRFLQLQKISKKHLEGLALEVNMGYYVAVKASSVQIRLRA